MSHKKNITKTPPEEKVMLSVPSTMSCKKFCFAMQIVIAGNYYQITKGRRMPTEEVVKCARYQFSKLTYTTPNSKLHIVNC